MKNKIIIVIACLIAAFGIGWLIYKKSPHAITNQLFAAIENNDFEEAKRAITQGANANEVRRVDWPLRPTYFKVPLYMAIEQSNPEIVELLLHNGASTAIEGWTISPIDKSIDIMQSSEKLIREKQQKIIGFLMQANANSKEPMIIQAILANNLDLVKKLSQQTKQAIKANVLSAAHLEHAAIFSGDKDIVQYVLNNIVESNSSVKNSRWLRWAIESNDEEMIDYILNLPQTDINIYDEITEPPLHAAVYYYIGGGNEAVVKKLLALGANPNIRNYHGDTPLINAALHGKKAMVVMLLNAGADPYLRNFQGETAYDNALKPISLKKNEPDIIKLLDEASATRKNKKANNSNQ